MSLAGLVAYGSSDEGSDDEVMSETPCEQPKLSNGFDKQCDNLVNNSSPKPAQQNDKIIEKNDNSFLSALPKPFKADTVVENEDDDVPLKKTSYLTINETKKKDKGPVKIKCFSLSDFKDVDEEIEKKKPKAKPSTIGSGLLTALPPPSGSLTTSTSFIPKAVSTKPSLTPTQVRKPPQKPVQKPPPKPSSLSSLKYDSNSEDEDEVRPSSSSSKSTIDFFSLDESKEVPVSQEAMKAHMLPEQTIQKKPEERLTSSVMDMPREEILLKNQAEVGPKLPVPEQEYRLDAQGNVALDEKAMEYLVGRRGVKRKNELMEANIIEINGDEMKPDEREWLVKALTEEPVQRPVSLGAGPSGASKKKHQITYLAHQAKAMEVELQNQWASNRVARNQTKSKYGF